MNLALIWLDTKRDAAIVIAATISGHQANQAFFKPASEIYADFVQKEK